jgi:phosphatidylserine/phosphatidylglycerophosphate/cardiolipin synthase-like enzyme
MSRIGICFAVSTITLGVAATIPAVAQETDVDPYATTYTFITEPTQGITPVYNFIKTATKTLDITIYELADTNAQTLLGQMAAKGVKVRVILDQNGEKSNNTTAYNYLSSHGVKVHWANTKYNLTHQKTITVDGARSMIMTLNLTSRYYSTSRDYAVIENAATDVAAIEATFNADFTNATITPSNGTDLVWSPTNSQTALLGIINGARKTLQVEEEEMEDSALVSALASAQTRGVTVQVIAENESNYYSYFNQLKSSGVKVVTYPTNGSLYIHAKMILADYGTTSAKMFLGSENFSSTSLTANRELGLIYANTTSMSSYNTTFISDFKGGTPY